MKVTAPIVYLAFTHSRFAKNRTRAAASPRVWFDRCVIE
jgi:hypothetical protein